MPEWRFSLLLSVLFGLWPNISIAAETCISAKCHGEIARLPNKHTGCDTCHQKADHKARQFSMVAEGRRLCLRCHTGAKRKNRHAAYQVAQCTICHSPHGSNNKAGLKNWPVSRLCAGCHPSDKQQATAHKPYREGNCTRCHDPHQSDHRALLRKKRGEVCATCHSAEKMFKDPYRHQPAIQGLCHRCHNPHQSKYPHLVRKKGEELCRTCHTKYPDMNRRTVHAAVKKRGCAGCHKPHAAKNPALLTEKMPDLCYGCHKRKDKAPVVHGAVKLGRCTGCHEPHASNNASLMHKPRVGDNCWNCHCDDVTRRKSVHWPVKGRVCDRCHDSHGAKERYLLKERAKDICGQCHGQQAPLASANVHGALKRADCRACHDPHGTGVAPLLKKPINQLCSACHPKQRTGGHFFTTPNGKPHPVSGRIDPLHMRRRLSCVSCHAMSSSTSPKLLRGAKNKTDLCRRCHIGGVGRLRTDIKRREVPSHNSPPALLKKQKKLKKLGPGGSLPPGATLPGEKAKKKKATPSPSKSTGKPSPEKKDSKPPGKKGDVP